MGCFIACFGSSNSKHSKSKKSTHYPHQNFSKKYVPAQHSKFREAGKIQDSTKTISESKNPSCNLTLSPDQNLFKRPAKCEPSQNEEPTEAANIQDSILESKKSITSISRDEDLLMSHDKFEPAQHAMPAEAEVLQDSVKPISGSRENDEQELNSTCKNRVVFDLKVNTSEKVKTNEVENCMVAGEEKGTTVNEEIEIKQGAKEENQNQSQSLSDSCNSSMISYPPMHRYHGCTYSDDEYPGMGQYYADYVGIDKLMIQEDSSESLFSLSIESRKQVNRVEVDDDKEVNSPLKASGSSEREMKSLDSLKQIHTAEFKDKEIKTTRNIFGSPDKGLNPIPRDRTKSVRSVLNPIENLSQWKVVKARTGSPPSFEEKENANQEQEFNIPISEEPSFKNLGHSSNQSADIMKQQDNDIAVDTSLSSWLVESEKTPLTKDSPSSIGNNSSLERVNSWRSFEDRPILGALSIEEIKQFSAPTTPRRSPSRNPDDMPIIGTVGSYWSLTGQATMDSHSSGSSRKGRPGRSRKCTKDKKAANIHATPLRKRFERALDRGTA